MDWLKKNQVGSLEHKRRLIEPEHPEVTIAQQCELLALARSSYYYQPVGETEENLHVMRLLDEQYTKTPFYGILRMTAWLKTQGYAVNEKRVARLLRVMGLEAIYPKPRVSLSDPHAHRYPYLVLSTLATREHELLSSLLVTGILCLDIGEYHNIYKTTNLYHHKGKEKLNKKFSFPLCFLAMTSS